MLEKFKYQESIVMNNNTLFGSLLYQLIPHVLCSSVGRVRSRVRITTSVIVLYIPVVKNIRKFNLKSVYYTNGTKVLKWIEEIKYLGVIANDIMNCNRFI